MNFEQKITTAEQKPAVRCAIRFLLAAILTASQIFGGCAPFVLGFTAAAGSGMGGLSALLGLLTGALLLMPFTAAMKYIAAGILIFSVSIAFYDTKLYQKPAFLPLITAACTAAVGFVYLSSSGFFSAEGAFFLLELILAGASAFCWHAVLAEDKPAPPSALFFAAVSVLIAMASIPLGGHFSLGRICAVVLVLAAGWRGGMGAGCAAGLAAGLAMDAATGELYFSMAYSAAALVAGLPRCSRAVYALLYLCGSLLALFWADSGAAAYALLETAGAGLIFLLLPQRLLRKAAPDRLSAPKGFSAPRILEKQLRATAAVFRDLYDSLTHGGVPVNDENIATVFDRAADQVCRACPLCATCWDADYVTTYNALNDATPFLTGQGRVLPSDFPSHFSTRCIRLTDFTAAVNTEFTALLLRRQYTRQLNEARKGAKEQYARLSELLTESADQITRLEESEDAVPAGGAAVEECEICTAVRPKAGEVVSGDTVASFRTEDGRVFLLLSDGMGCGEDARRESAMTVRLLTQFLQSGVEPATALRTLNTALTLHSDESGAFTTIDLMALTLRSGAASFYKYGAAPSYIKHGGSIRRITGSVLPAGLSGWERVPDATNLCLSPGDFAILVSDGFVDPADDGWLQAMLAQWDGASVQSLTASLMDASAQHSGRSDDTSILVLRMPALPSAEV